ncbi:hypothetical protein [uncultured Hymenobacter sp.]|uniref:hypothetical protein n=1 Tax=uncultured Hymenobacter sp. TaxID=170016 RepID=UPI0035CBABDD
MKTTFTAFFTSLLLLCTLTTQAQTIRRCNNTGITGTNIYTTLQAAHDAASNGDIIYLEPTSTSYGSLTCTKVLTIIGTGYFLAQNPGLQLDAREALVGSVVFNSGSAGSRITRCVIDNTVSIAANRITVERNHLTSVYIGYNNLRFTYTSVDDIVIRNNYIQSQILPYAIANTALNDITISNNIIGFGIGVLFDNGYSSSNLSNILILNNVIGSLTGSSNANITVDNAVIKNNILTYTGTGTSFTPRNNTYSNNISGNTAFGTANGNQQNVAPTALFVGGGASTDGAFQLQAAPNPAIGTGENGANVGAFGGATPYRIAGIPNVPTLYQYNESVTGNTLNVTISTRSNN